MTNFRDRRRTEREQKLGPEKKIVDMSLEMAKLECGHTIVNPPIQKTKYMRLPKFYRCIQCIGTVLVLMLVGCSNPKYTEEQMDDLFATSSVDRCRRHCTRKGAIQIEYFDGEKDRFCNCTFLPEK